MIKENVDAMTIIKATAVTNGTTGKLSTRLCSGHVRIVALYVLSCLMSIVPSIRLVVHEQQTTSKHKSGSDLPNHVARLPAVANATRNSLAANDTAESVSQRRAFVSEENDGVGGLPTVAMKATNKHPWTSSTDQRSHQKVISVGEGGPLLSNTTEDWMEWKEIHSKVLQTIRLPLATSNTADISGDRLGDSLLPPRLSLPTDLVDELKYGVLFAGTGRAHFAVKRILPAIENLRETLQIPDAKERTVRRAKGDYSNGCDAGFAILASQEFLDGPLRNVIPFFDAVYTPQDLPNYPPGWLETMEKQKGSRTYTKAIKVHSMASSPFNSTIMMDFDTFPCRADFVEPLGSMLNGSNIAMSNEFNGRMGEVHDYRHWMAEHNSALVVLNMETVLTRILLGLYVQAFHTMLEHNPKLTRDQPSFMVALRALSDPPPGETYTNKWATSFQSQHSLGSLRHVDLPPVVFCRKRNSDNLANHHCGKGSTCLLAHKPEDRQANEEVKIFGIGSKKTGTTSLNDMFMHQQKVQKDRGKRNKICCKGRSGSQATNYILNHNTTLALELADTYKYFQDSPWCNEPQRLYRIFAVRYPEARFVLTFRESDQWWSSVVRWTVCQQGPDLLFGDAKLQRYADVLNAKSVSRENMTAAYELHNSAIHEFFHNELKQPSRLLEMDFTDPKWKDGVGWATYCKFVRISEEDCPLGDLPHSNVSSKSCETN
jgi:hypothetical protein